MSTTTERRHDTDWLVVGSGFGGSVAALRLAEKGYRVSVVERGREYDDDELPTSASDRRRFVWAPAIGLRGIMRNVVFRHVFSSTQTGVGGGSLVYGGVLFRPHDDFFAHRQWHGLDDWKSVLEPRYREAERMLGATTTPWESMNSALTREVAEEFCGEHSPAPVGVFFGMPGVRVPDPYFGGEGPDRTGCTRCGQCMTGCRTGAANRLTKNYLWFARKRGARVLAEHEAVDVVPLGAADGSDGYRVTIRRAGGILPGRRTTLTTSGVVFAGGAVGTNALLGACRSRGSLPGISDHLGRLARTNSEVMLSVLLPEDVGTWRDVAASSRVVLDGDTQVEFLTYGPRGDFMRLFFTLMTGPGPRGRRLLAWLGAVVRHPRRWLTTLRSGWSERTLMMLVMQPRDNAIRFRTVRGLTGWRLRSERDADRPAPTHIEIGARVASWLAKRTGGIAQASVFQVFGDRPMTAHVLGGAVIGADAATGVVDHRMQVFGYRNLVVCDAAALPANPGVNPALTITALAEHAMAQVPAAGLGR